MNGTTKVNKDNKLNRELVYVTDKNNLITYIDEIMINTLSENQEKFLNINADYLYDEEVPKIVMIEKKKTIAKNKIWHAAIKLAKNYEQNRWFEEFTRPVYENSRVVGYQTTLKPLERSRTHKATKIYREMNKKKSIFFIWENFYYRSILYLICFISISALSLYDKNFAFAYTCIPVLIYYCEVIKSRTFFETKRGSFKDVTLYIFNKDL
ncbi:hypothetical protein TW85_22370 [Marinomonas sp. S3726]|uniref:hypothetical protein n=1 Tax=Marinomonas sp. S3726 TaxID=579484 RepID=UPI0005FA66B2|nr:hypothetical protein [Marinomonas sp. S3726]KJZ09280.1 hypothetical protein TW85_22370 [Marinomonas sp. S3726]